MKRPKSQGQRRADATARHSRARLKVPAAEHEKREATALQVSDEHYRNVYETAPLAFVIWDRDTRVVDWNKQAEVLFGWARDEVLGRNFFDFLIPSDVRPQVDEVVRQLLHRELPNRSVNQNLTKGGKIIVCEWSNSLVHNAEGEVIGVLSLALDITERKRIEAEMSQLAAIVASSDDAIIGKDLEGVITSWNAGAERIYGYRAAEVVGRPIALLLPPDRRTELDEILVRLRRGERIDHFDTIRVRKDGAHIPVSVSIAPIKDAAERIVGAASIARDLSERQRTAAQVRELQAFARQRERLADIGAITAQIVHDLGNPLAGLAMQAQLILRHARRDETQPLSTVRKSVEWLATEVRRLNALLAEFMDFSREQRLDLKPLHLPRFLGAVVDLWRPMASTREISLRLDVEDTALAIVADEEKLHRVFENLVKNAVEAIDRGPGEIKIRVAAPESEKICISVEDTGPGIPEKVEVFRLFETTKPHGSGLGLPIVRQIVLAHGGGIHFAQRSPHGTVFHVELPRRGPIG